LSTDFFAHLRNSASYRSFRSEMRVEAVLRKLGWKTKHSPDYIDLREEKHREIDVTASRSWDRTRKSVQHVAHLHLVIECKGIHKEALLLAKMDRSKKADQLYHHWLGLDDDNLRDAIGNVVQQAGFDAAKVLRRFEKIAYPGGQTAVGPLLVNAPPASVRASAIREATREESDESLIRKATLQVFSAVMGSVAEVRDESLRLLHDDLQERQPVDRLEYVLNRMQSAATEVYLFHPIVVVDTKLVAVNHAGKLAEVNWARLQRGRIVSTERRWLDVVSSEHFDSYANELTAWYSRVLGRIAEAV
jgi:hypothetical protein